MTWRLGPPGSEVDIPPPFRFEIQPVEVVRKTRMASGKLRADVVATKQRFILGYRPISAAAVQILQTEYDRKDFLSFQYEDRGITRTATVWFDRFPRGRLLTGPDVEYWAHFEIVLEEQ